MNAKRHKVHPPSPQGATIFGGGLGRYFDWTVKIIIFSLFTVGQKASVFSSKALFFSLFSKVFLKLVMNVPFSLFNSNSHCDDWNLTSLYSDLFYCFAYLSNAAPSLSFAPLKSMFYCLFHVLYWSCNYYSNIQGLW